MKNRIWKIAPLSMILVLFAWQDAMAAKVYQWTDEQGVVHFSDVPPVDDETLETKEIDFIDFAEAGSSDDEYSIINQLERMSEWRRQTTEERLAKRELQIEEQRLADERHSSRFNSPSTSSVIYPSSSYLSPYYANPGYSSYHNRRRSFHGFSIGYHNDRFKARFGHHSSPVKLRHYKAGPGL